MFFYFTFLLMFVSLTSLSIYLRIRHRDHRLILWASMIILCGGLVGLQVVLEKAWIPYLIEQRMATTTIEVSIMLTAFLNTVINTFPYYGILVFFIIYNGYDYHWKWLPIVLSLPLWFTLLFQTNLLENRVDKGFIAIWGLCYIVAMIWLAIRSIVIEPKLKHRLNHAMIGLVFLIPISTLNIYHFSNQLFSDQLLLTIPVVCIVSLLFIFFLYLRDAFLGVKRKSVQVVHVGTGLIHHSLKNSIGKIKLNAVNIRRSMSLGKYDDIDAYIDNLLKTHEAMLETMSKISNVVSDKMEVRKKETDISYILEEVTEYMETFPCVQVTKQYVSTTLFIDRLLITECLQNICNNAIDAMKEDGILHINLETRKNKVLLVIRDTGRGMTDLQLQNIFEPFYSTKNRSGMHFGLGMYQVKKVMDAHKGKIEIKSAPNKGTTIVLTFKKTS